MNLLALFSMFPTPLLKVFPCWISLRDSSKGLGTEVKQLSDSDLLPVFMNTFQTRRGELGQARIRLRWKGWKYQKYKSHVQNKDGKKVSVFPLCNRAKKLPHINPREIETLVIDAKCSPKAKTEAREMSGYVHAVFLTDVKFVACWSNFRSFVVTHDEICTDSSHRKPFPGINCF